MLNFGPRVLTAQSESLCGGLGASKALIFKVRGYAANYGISANSGNPSLLGSETTTERRALKR